MNGTHEKFKESKMIRVSRAGKENGLKSRVISTMIRKVRRFWSKFQDRTVPNRNTVHTILNKLRHVYYWAKYELNQYIKCVPKTD